MKKNKVIKKIMFALALILTVASIGESISRPLCYTPVLSEHTYTYSEYSCMWGYINDKDPEEADLFGAGSVIKCTPLEMSIIIHDQGVEALAEYWLLKVGAKNSDDTHGNDYVIPYKKYKNEYGIDPEKIEEYIHNYLLEDLKSGKYLCYLEFLHNEKIISDDEYNEVIEIGKSGKFSNSDIYYKNKNANGINNNLRCYADSVCLGTVELSKDHKTSVSLTLNGKKISTKKNSEIIFATPVGKLIIPKKYKKALKHTSFCNARNYFEVEEESWYYQFYKSIIYYADYYDVLPNEFCLEVDVNEAYKAYYANKKVFVEFVKEDYSGDKNNAWKKHVNITHKSIYCDNVDDLFVWYNGNKNKEVFYIHDKDGISAKEAKIQKSKDDIEKSQKEYEEEEEKKKQEAIKNEEEEQYKNYLKNFINADLSLEDPAQMIYWDEAEANNEIKTGKYGEYVDYDPYELIENYDYVIDGTYTYMIYKDGHVIMIITHTDGSQEMWLYYQGTLTRYN